MMAKIEWYEEILALEPGSKVFFPFAKRLESEGLRDKAVAVLRQGLLQHPEYMEARVLLAHLLQDSGSRAEAAAEAQAVFQRLSGYPGFWDAAAVSESHKPGDAALLLSLLAEGLRRPGLTLSSVLRQALAVVESAPVADAAPSAAEPEMPPAAAEVQEPSAAAEVPEPSGAAQMQEPPAAVEVPEPSAAALMQEDTMPVSATAPFDDIPLADAVFLDAEEPEVSGTPVNADALDEAEATENADAELDDITEAAEAEAVAEIDAADEREEIAESAEIEETAASGSRKGLSSDDDDESFESIEEAVYVDESDLPLLAASETETGHPEADAGEDFDETAAAEEPEEVFVEEEEFAERLSAEAEIDEAVAGKSAAAESGTPVVGLEEADLLESDEDIDESLLDAALLDAAQLLESTLADLEEEAHAEGGLLDGDLLDGGLLDGDLPDGGLRKESPLTEVPLDEGLLDESLLDESPLDESLLDGGPSADAAADSDTEGEADTMVADAEVLNTVAEGGEELPADADPAPLAEAGEDDQSLTEPEPAEDADENDEPQPAEDLESRESPEFVDEDEPVRTRSMAEVLAEQGDTDGALGIYAELAAVAEPGERDSLVARMEELNKQKTVEKPVEKFASEPKSAAAKANRGQDREKDRSGLRSMLENLAGRLEKRAKTKS